MQEVAYGQEEFHSKRFISQYIFAALDNVGLLMVSLFIGIKFLINTYEYADNKT